MIKESIEKARRELSVLNAITLEFQSNQDFLLNNEMEQCSQEIINWIPNSKLNPEESLIAYDLIDESIVGFVKQAYSLEILHTYLAFFSLLKAEDLKKPEHIKAISDSEEKENEIAETFCDLVTELSFKCNYTPLNNIIDMLCKEYDPMHIENLNWLWLVTAVRND